MIFDFSREIIAKIKLLGNTYLWNLYLWNLQIVEFLAISGLHISKKIHYFPQ